MKKILFCLLFAMFDLHASEGRGRNGFLNGDEIMSRYVFGSLVGAFYVVDGVISFMPKDQSSGWPVSMAKFVFFTGFFVVYGCTKLCGKNRQNEEELIEEV